MREAWRIQRLPRRVRSVIGRLPQRLQPAPDPTVAVVAVDDAGEVQVSCSGRIDGFTMLTGVREAAGTLWFGSLHGTALATMPRPAGPPG